MDKEKNSIEADRFQGVNMNTFLSREGVHIGTLLFARKS
jgi:hypothetical protein